MEKPPIPKLKENKIENKEGEINPKIVKVLEKWAMKYVKNLEGFEFHGEEHTNNVVEFSQKILSFFNDVSKKDKQLLTLSARYHDSIQGWEENITKDGKFKKVKLGRFSGKNEEASADLLCEYMDDVNDINPGIFNKEDKDKVKTTIMATVAEYSPEYNTIVNGSILKESPSPLEISLALADLASAGIKSSEEFIKEGDSLFIEENLDIKEVIQKGNISDEQKEWIKGRIVSWSNFQIAFSSGRYKVFLEKELKLFPEDKQEEVKKYFSQYEENIEFTKKVAKERSEKTFKELIKDVYNVNYQDKTSN
ncbi:MAG: hypothetical protein U9R00_01225 [Patescibacteria group bacterium]|nr:hypothetical protein [Patescibacteria group bacterium]